MNFHAKNRVLSDQDKFAVYEVWDGLLVRHQMEEAWHRESVWFLL